MTNTRAVDHGEARLTVVGLGAAGASLAWRLVDAGVPFEVVEAPAAADVRSPDRTWSTWGAHGPGPFGHLVAASWPRIRLVAPDGAVVTADLGSWRYRSLHSTDLDRAVRAKLAAAGVAVHERVLAGRPPAPAVDTRPVPVPTDGRTLLWQHFLGYRVARNGPCSTRDGHAHGLPDAAAGRRGGVRVRAADVADGGARGVHGVLRAPADGRAVPRAAGGVPAAQRDRSARGVSEEERGVIP